MFSFETYAKNERQKATKCSSETAEFYWVLMDMCLPKFDIYQVTVVSPDFF